MERIGGTHRWSARTEGASSAALLRRLVLQALQLNRQPVQTLVQTVAGRSAGCLDVPVSAS